MTYNLLADSLCDINDPDFIDIPIDVLRWSNRCERLQKQLLKQSPDLACLQELDADRVEQFMRPFDAAHWSFIFTRRTGQNRDGCALLWKTAVFELLDQRALEFKHMPGADGVTPLTFMDRDNVAQIVALRHRASGRLLVVGNCHLLFNQNRGEIKLAQLVGMFRAIAELKARHQSAAGPPPAVLIGGDFNSTPLSGIYTLVTSGVLDLRNADTRLLSGQQRFVSRFNPMLPVMQKAHEIRQIMEIAAKCFGAAPVLPADAATELATVPAAMAPPTEQAEEEDDEEEGEENDDAASALPRRRADDDDDDDDGDYDAVVPAAAAASSSNNDTPLVLHHTLDLQSAYPRASELARNAATCMRKRRTDQKWVDHIFTSPQLRVLSVLAVPHNVRDKISPFGLPTRNHPSDHLPLCAVVEFK